MKQIVLVHGLNYFFGSTHFKQYAPVAVSDDIAATLLRVVTPDDKNFFMPYTKSTSASIEALKNGTVLRERGDITSDEIRNKTQVAGESPKDGASGVIKAAAEDVSEPIPEEETKSSDFTVSEAISKMSEIKELQSLLDFTANDSRKGVQKALEDLMDKMGPSGAGTSGEEAVIV
jgi:hypothetical protein